MKLIITVFGLSVLLVLGACEKTSLSDTLLPLEPFELSAIATSSKSITLSWTDNSTNELGFIIERKTGTDTYTILDSVGVNITTYLDTKVITGSTYSYRIYTYNLSGTSLTYSNQVTIAAVALPIITTQPVTNITLNSVVSGGDITDDGGSAVLAKGLVWSKSHNPTVDLATKTVDGEGEGSFTTSITGLSHSTKYYIKAYATNTSGTAYGNVIVFNTERTGLTVAGGNGEGTANNQLNRPVSLSIDDSDNMYIAEYWNDRIQKWTLGASEGVTVAGGNGKGSAANQLEDPTALQIDQYGNIYVCDQSNDRIQKFALGLFNAETVAGGNGYGTSSSQLWRPIDLQIDKDGIIYVCDYGNHRVQKWLPGAIEGITVAGGNGRGGASNQLSHPTGIFVDRFGAIYISDNSNDRIQKWTIGATEGVTVAGGNGSGNANNKLKAPKDIFVDKNGNIYISDEQNHRIQKWLPGAQEGITVAGGNGRGGASNQLSYPTGIFVDSKGYIYIADYWNNRIQRWAPF